MADSSKTVASAAQSVLLPQGDHAGKPGLPLGNRAFTLVGSRNRSHLHLVSSTISRCHACIISTRSGVYVRDLASRTGIIVNGRRGKEMDLQDGDILQIGSFKFRFQEPVGTMHVATVPRPPLAMLETPEGHSVPLDERSLLIGRRRTCEIPLDMPTVSSTHALIFECDGTRYIRDLGTRTGTQVNGQAVHQHTLKIGDEIRIGDAVFHYVPADAASEALPDELEDVSDLPMVESDHLEEDEVDAALLPSALEAQEPVPGPAVEEDFAAEYAPHLERPADPIVAQRMRGKPIPFATEDELAPAPDEWTPEEHNRFSPGRRSTAEPAVSVAEGDDYLADDAGLPVESGKWGNGHDAEAETAPEATAGDLEWLQEQATPVTRPAEPTPELEELQPETAAAIEDVPAPPSPRRPAFSTRAYELTSGELVETQWGPIDFSGPPRPVNLTPPAPIAETGLTASADAIEEEDLGLDFWGPSTDAPRDVFASVAAREDDIPSESVTPTSEAAESSPVSETDAPLDIDEVAVDELEALPADEMAAEPLDDLEALHPYEVDAAVPAKIESLPQPEAEIASLDALESLQPLDDQTGPLDELEPLATQPVEATAPGNLPESMHAFGAETGHLDELESLPATPLHAEAADELETLHPFEVETDALDEFAALAPETSLTTHPGAIESLSPRDVETEPFAELETLAPFEFEAGHLDELESLPPGSIETPAPKAAAAAVHPPELSEVELSPFEPLVSSALAPLADSAPPVAEVADAELIFNDLPSDLEELPGEVPAPLIEAAPSAFHEMRSPAIEANPTVPGLEQAPAQYKNESWPSLEDLKVPADEFDLFGEATSVTPQVPQIDDAITLLDESALIEEPPFVVETPFAPVAESFTAPREQEALHFGDEPRPLAEIAAHPREPEPVIHPPLATASEQAVVEPAPVSAVELDPAIETLPPIEIVSHNADPVDSPAEVIAEEITPKAQDRDIITPEAFDVADLLSPQRLEDQLEGLVGESDAEAVAIERPAPPVEEHHEIIIPPMAIVPTVSASADLPQPFIVPPKLAVENVDLSAEGMGNETEPAEQHPLAAEPAFEAATSNELAAAPAIEERLVSAAPGDEAPVEPTGFDIAEESPPVLDQPVFSDAEPEQASGQISGELPAASHEIHPDVPQEPVTQQVPEPEALIPSVAQEFASDHSEPAHLPDDVDIAPPFVSFETSAAPEPAPQEEPAPALAGHEPTVPHEAHEFAAGHAQPSQSSGELHDGLPVTVSESPALADPVPQEQDGIQIAADEPGFPSVAETLPSSFVERVHAEPEANADSLAADAILKLGQVDFPPRTESQSGSEPEPANIDFERINEDAPAAEPVTDAFYSGPVDELQPMAFSLDMPSEVIDPVAESELELQTAEEGETEILSFEASASTPEAKGVVAAWQSADAAPAAADFDAPALIEHSADHVDHPAAYGTLPELPGPVSPAFEVSDVERGMGDSLDKQSPTEVTAWAHDDSIAFENPATVDSSVSDIEFGLTASETGPASHLEISPDAAALQGKIDSPEFGQLPDQVEPEPAGSMWAPDESVIVHTSEPVSGFTGEIATGDDLAASSEFFAHSGSPAEQGWPKPEDVQADASKETSSPSKPSDEGLGHLQPQTDSIDEVADAMGLSAEAEDSTLPETIDVEPTAKGWAHETFVAPGGPVSIDDELTGFAANATAADLDIPATADWSHEESIPLEVDNTQAEKMPGAEVGVSAFAFDLAPATETIENTEPTLDSALNLAPVLEPIPAQAPLSDDLTAFDTNLTDTAFDAAVNDFTGSGFGPLVEESPLPADPTSDTFAPNEIAEPFALIEPVDSFASEIEELPEFSLPQPLGAGDSEYFQAESLDSGVFEADIDSGDLSAANLSSNLTGEAPPPTQSLTSAEIADEIPTVDATHLPADVTLTTAAEVEGHSIEPASDEGEFLAIHEDALLEPLEHDELSLDELPAVETAPERNADEPPSTSVVGQPLADIADDVRPLAEPAPVVAAAVQPPAADVEVRKPAEPPPSVAEIPKPAPAQPPTPNPYFGMERDSGSFLGGMPLSFAAPLRSPPKVPAPQPQAERLPPPRLAPVSAPAPDVIEKSAFPLISPVAPIHGLAPIPRFEPLQPPVLRQAQTPLGTPQAELPRPAAATPPIPVTEAPAIEDESNAELFADELEEIPTTDGALEALEDPDDLLFKAEAPVELFDGATDKLDDLPDGLETIDDLDGALAESESTELVEAPRSEPVIKSPAAVGPIAIAAPTKAPVPAAPPAAPLRSLTGGQAPPQKAAPAASVAVAPFAGSRRTSGPFTGIATPPKLVNSSDIFSQETFPPPDEEMFRPQPIDIPPTTVRTPGVNASAAPKRLEPSQKASNARGQSIGRPSPAQGAPDAKPPKKTESAPKPATEPPSKKKWWQSIRLLLPLMLLIMFGAVFAIARFLPPRTVVQGTLQFKGLDQLNPLQRKDQFRSIRELLNKPDLRMTVAGALESQGVSPGFTQDALALNALSNPENSPADRNLLTFKRFSTDPDDDRKRMQSLLLAVYSESKTPTDAARRDVDRQVRAAQDNVNKLQDEFTTAQVALAALSDQIRTATGSSGRDVLLNPGAAVSTLLRLHDHLVTELTDANTRATAARDTLNRAEMASLALPGVVIDPKLGEMRVKLSNLTTRLVSASAVPAGALETASQAFEDSLQSLDQDLMLVALSSRSPVASSYASTARQATAEIRALLAREKQSRDDVALLRTQVAVRLQKYLKQVWTDDESLKGMIGERNTQARRYRAAADAGNTDEIIAARTALDALDLKIDARRKELAIGGQNRDELHQKLQQAVDRLSSENKTNARRMASDLALLEVPPANRLPTEEQSSMASIGERVAAVQAGRDQYLAANNAGHNQDADGEIQLIQQGIAEQQARIDAYEQQIAPDPPTLVSARAALDAAQDSEAKAQVEYVDNLNLLASARELTDAQDHVAQLRTAAEAARADLEALRDKANDVVQLQPPDDAAAQLIYEPDKRHWYMVGALGGLAALFAGPIWMGLKESRPQAPFASIAAASDRGDADTDEFDRMHSLHNEGHPATM